MGKQSKNNLSTYFQFQWHSLGLEEQAKYFEQAQKERQIHKQMYPGWSARDNYAKKQDKKRSRKIRDKTTNNPSSPYSRQPSWNSSNISSPIDLSQPLSPGKFRKDMTPLSKGTDEYK